MKKKYSNALIHETSPYLRQHAHNPVNWHIWGEEAFELARATNRPILLSIGYSSCHWCHVMEQESFEDEQVASFMNRHFVNIKVDREERPDIDQIYMEALQAITGGGGGWPLNCFLLPDRRPFFAGTYFPPQTKGNRASWIQVLQNIHDAFQERQQEVKEQAQKILQYLEQSNQHFISTLEPSKKTKPSWSTSYLKQTYKHLKENFDQNAGGFGAAPKFPQTTALRFLLHYHYFTKDSEALKQLQLSLSKMIHGGIYDQIGGGFSRYTVDQDWLIPHFEKMLYDNALLLGLLADTYKLDKKNLYKNCLKQSFSFLEKSMQNKAGGFYSALDADSEGIEGKYYTWSSEEIQQVLKEEADLFIAFYGVEATGNWENTNILYIPKHIEDFAREKNWNIEEIIPRLEKSKQILLKHRQFRTPPNLDDKILLSWNALLVTAYAKAYQALQEAHYKNIAIKTLLFLEQNFKDQANQLWHSYKDGQNKQEAFLDDYAFLTEAFLEVYQISFDKIYLKKAEELVQIAIQIFWDEKNKLFFYTRNAQKDIIVRKKNLYDNTLPSGNSVMVHNLEKLYLVTGQQKYQIYAEQMLLRMQDSIQKFPQSFANWANAVFPKVYNYQEIAIVGENYAQKAQEVQKQFLPHAFIMANAKADSDLPLLANRNPGKETLIFICSNFMCKLPVNNVQAMLELIKEK